MMESVLIDVKGVSAMLGLSERSVWRMVSSEKMVPPLRLNGSRRWKKADVLQWVEDGCKPLKKEAILCRG